MVHLPLRTSPASASLEISCRIDRCSPETLGCDQQRHLQRRRDGARAARPASSDFQLPRVRSGILDVLVRLALRAPIR